MKKLFVLFASFLTLAVCAQKKPVPLKKPAAPSPLRNLNDSASYAIGISVAKYYSGQGMKNLNAAMVSRAITDVLGGKKAMLNELQSNDVIMQVMNKAQEAKSHPNIEAGEKFLSKNRTKGGVKTTASGLQYEVITQGTGPKPGASDTVVCNYAGTLIDGTEFDNSYKRGQPITFPVSGVIRGWTEALQLMPQGSKYKLYIPQQLAYGPNENGAIPAGSVLIFEVELLEVHKK